MSTHYIYNGVMHHGEYINLRRDNRGLRYGDGVFETMKAVDGRLLLESLHFDRLFRSLNTLGFDVPKEFNRVLLVGAIQDLLAINGHLKSARLRLNVFRAANRQSFEYLLESFDISAFTPPKSIHVTIFENWRKSMESFSSLKSNNYLGYLLAADYAREKKIDDALILNTTGRIAESSIANIFTIQDGLIQTPPTTEGCIDGVFRRFLLEWFGQQKIQYREEPLTIAQLLAADEIFLTNAVRGIISVSEMDGRKFSSDISESLKKRVDDYSF